MSSRQLPLGITPRRTYSLDGFIAGNNRECLQRLTAMTENSGEQGPRFLYIHAEPGLGRSHLLQAACNATNGAGRSAIYLPLLELVARSPVDLASIDSPLLLALDDLQAIEAHRAWQQALVAAFDSVRLAGGKVLASGCRPPDKMDRLLPDLRSRLGWGEIHQLQPLDDEGKLHLLQRQADSAGLTVNDDVGRYLLNRVSRDMPTLLDWLARLDRESMAAQRRLTIPFVREVLSRNTVQT